MILLALCFILWSIRIHPQSQPQPESALPCHATCPFAKLATSSTSTSFDSVSGQCEMHMQIYNNFTFSHAFTTMLSLVNRLLRRKVRTAIEGLATIFDWRAASVASVASAALASCGKCLCIKNRLWLCSAQIEQSINPNLLTV